MKFCAISLLALVSAINIKGDQVNKDEIPTMIYAGMGSKCSDAGYTGLVQKIQKGTGFHVECRETQLKKTMKDQAAAECMDIQRNNKFNKQKQINVMGVSQGGLIARFILEECDIAGAKGTAVRNLLTIGTPNMGFSKATNQGCKFYKGDGKADLCKFEDAIKDNKAYSQEMQNLVSVAGFYRDPKNIDEYKAGSSFLANLNNEIGQESELFEKHKSRFESLHSAMFVMFKQDDVIYPPSSAVFGEVTFKGKEGEKKVKMEATELYKNDNLGLKFLKDDGKLRIIEIDAKHAEFKEHDIDQTFLPFLKS